MTPNTGIANDTEAHRPDANHSADVWDLKEFAFNAGFGVTFQKK